MSATEHAPQESLGDVLDRAFAQWQPRFLQRSDSIFGGVGPPRGGVDPEMRTYTGRDASRLDPQELADPWTRMFATKTGERALGVVGNEDATLAMLQRLAVEIVAETLQIIGAAGKNDRFMVVLGTAERPPALVRLSPDVSRVEETRLISDELDLPLRALVEAAARLSDPAPRTPGAVAARQVLESGPRGLTELFMISQPEVVLTRRPRMIRLAVPSPHIEISRGSRTSTAGILCRDADGRLGVTACLHGTGPPETRVRVGPHECRVKSANPVQDTVFIPLPEGFVPPSLAGRGGVLEDSEPARADRVYFDGAKNPNSSTRIFGTDNGLLRSRPTVQLKVQTGPDTDEGDSGSALIDKKDRILGFAFERTAYDDYPQFTDWIWAANALRALGLDPI